MISAEVMAKARYKYNYKSDWKWYKENYPALADDMIEEARAELRALAEMEPTLDMRDAFESIAFEPGTPYWRKVSMGFRAGILAAASEDEDLGRSA